MNTLKKWLMACLLVTTEMIYAQEVKDIFTFKVGDIEVSVLREIEGKLQNSILIGATPEMLQECMPDGTCPNSISAFLVRTSEKTVLIDAGLGVKLFDLLQSIEISLEKIDAIFITHLHGDHIGGMLKFGKVMFPNAQIYLSQPEYDYWTDDEAMKIQSEKRKETFAFAKEVLTAYKERLNFFIPNEINENPTTLLTGINAIANYGHTPGHTIYLIQSNDDKLLIWGDMTHAMAIQMPYPQVAVTYDTNPEQAIISRKKVLDFISKNNITATGIHIPAPFTGKVKDNSKGGYIFENF